MMKTIVTKLCCILLSICLFFNVLSLPCQDHYVYGATIKLDQKKLELDAGYSYLLELINAKPTSKHKIKWSSSDKSVAKVSSDGVVSALHAGKTTITAKFKGKKYKCKVCVTGNYYDDNDNYEENDVTEIKQTCTQITLNVGECFSFDANTYPDKTATKKWETSNSSVVGFVNNTTGRMRANAPGNAIITATSGKATATWYVTIVDDITQTIKPSETSITLKPNESKIITMNGYGDIPNETLYWSCLDTSVCSVSFVNGYAKKLSITGINSGNTTVIITSDKRFKALTISVNVSGNTQHNNKNNNNNYYYNDDYTSDSKESELEYLQGRLEKYQYDLSEWRKSLQFSQRCLEEAKEQLARAESNKVQVLRDGRFVYEIANPDAVKRAENDVASWEASVAQWILRVNQYTRYVNETQAKIDALLGN